MKNLLVLFGLMFVIFACSNDCLNMVNECLNGNFSEKNNNENNQGNSNTEDSEKRPTTLQEVVDNANTGEEIDLSKHELTNYTATIDKKLTIKNGSLDNAKLQITGENVKLEKIEKVSVSTSSRLTITNSKLSDLLIGGSGETSRSTPSSSEMTLAMVTVTGSEIENVELNGFNSQLNITDKTTKIEDIVISTKAKVILESGSYEGMKAPTVINDGEVARVDMTNKTELSVLSVYSSPQKLEYNIGDKIDLAGLIVMGTYSTDVETFKSAGWKSAGIDTITKCEDEKDYTVSYDFNTAGVSIVTVTSTKYPEIKCNFHVFVKELQNSGTSQPEKEEIEIDNISVKTLVTPKTLYKAGEKLDLSCYQVVGTYNGFEINLPFTSEPANGSDLKSSGEITVTFYYDYKPVTTQTITVTESHTVTFKDGEKTLYTLKVAGGELLKLPVVDERTGYTFDGWYNGETKIEAGYEVTGDITLHAKWNADTYTIAYNLNGGKCRENFTLTYKRNANEKIILPTADDIIREGYEFAGWYDDDNNRITEIPSDTAQNISVTAKWYNAICTVSEAKNVILELSGEGPYDIAVTGEITNVNLDIQAIKDGLNGNQGAKVNLDLSQTTEWDELPVWSFEGCINLTSIILPDSVTSIGDTAFQNCSNLKSINIPNGVTSIDKNTFNGCSSLTEIIIPDSVTSIVYNAFYLCDSVKTLVTGNGLTSLDYLPITSALESITIGDSITEIGDNKFYEFTNLKSVTFADNSQLTKIGENAFCDCSQLTEITIPDGVQTISKGAFGRTGFTSVQLPDSVIEMGTDIFSGCSNLETVTLSNSIKSIPAATFYECTNLTSIIIPEGVTSIGDSAFSHCSQLTSITFPESVTAIGINVFDTCSELTSFIVHESNQNFSTLEDGKILCDKNKETLIAYPSAKGYVTILNGIKTIAGNAFVDCTELTDITIPNSVTAIGNGAFGRTGFTSVQLPDFITEMGTDVFCDCPNLETVKLPKNITSIPRATFFMCDNLGNIEIPDNVTSIGDIAFSACSALTSIDIPDSVKTIERNAFSDCSSLKSVTIGNGVTSIGETAFGGCSSLETVNYRGTQDQWEGIEIDTTNYELTSATINYNYTGE